MTTFPILLAYEIFYFEEGKVFHLPGNKQRIQLSEAEYEKRIAYNRKQNISYMLLYDYMLVLKKEHWEKVPSLIPLDEVELNYELSLLNEMEYVHFKYLHSEYAKDQSH
jgi:hypothetical protein